MRKFAFLLFILLATSTSIAGDDSNCMLRKYRMYSQANVSMENELTQLIVQVAPRYSDVVNLYMNDQLRMVEESLLAVEYLATQEPTKLRKDKPLNYWLNLNEQDRQQIASQSKRYAELLRLREVARNRPPHPDGDGLRNLMRTEIVKRPEYVKLMEEFSRAVNEAESIKCE
jgi:hypothetical protein